MFLECTAANMVFVVPPYEARVTAADGTVSTIVVAVPECRCAAGFVESNGQCLAILGKTNQLFSDDIMILILS